MPLRRASHPGLAAGFALLLWSALMPAPAGAAIAAIDQLPGMPPVVDPTNLYSETTATHLSPAVAGALSRVYVPNRETDDVYVIDPSTFKVVNHFKVGI